MNKFHNASRLFVWVVVLLSGSSTDAVERKIWLHWEGGRFDEATVLVDGESLGVIKGTLLRKHVKSFSVPHSTEASFAVVRSGNKLSNSHFIPAGSTEIVGSIFIDERSQLGLKLYERIVNPSTAHPSLEAVAWDEETETEVSYSQSFSIDEGVVVEMGMSNTSEDWQVTADVDGKKTQVSGRIGGSVKNSGGVDLIILEGETEVSFDAQLGYLFEEYFEQRGTFQHKDTHSRSSDMRIDGAVWKTGRVKWTNYVRRGIATAVIGGKRYDLVVRVVESTHAEFIGQRRADSNQDGKAAMSRMLERPIAFLGHMYAAPRAVEMTALAIALSVGLFSRVSARCIRQWLDERDEDPKY